MLFLYFKMHMYLYMLTFWLYLHLRFYILFSFNIKLYFVCSKEASHFRVKKELSHLDISFEYPPCNAG